MARNKHTSEHINEWIFIDDGDNSDNEVDNNEVDNNEVDNNEANNSDNENNIDNEVAEQSSKPVAENKQKEITINDIEDKPMAKKTQLNNDLEQQYPLIELPHITLKRKRKEKVSNSKDSKVNKDSNNKSTTARLRTNVDKITDEWVNEVLSRV